MKTDVYGVITDRIIEILETGTVPWHRPWKGTREIPRNYVSRKPYRGINAFLLHGLSCYASPFWLTFNQVKTMEGRVKKGEKSFPVVFWKIFEEEKDGEIKKIPFLRYHNVFNIAQCEGIPIPPETGGGVEFKPIEKCEEVVARMPNRPLIEHTGDRACYSPLFDRVRMPEKETFESPETYYATLYHELTHATGHLSRLNRKGVTEPIQFGSDPYSREELIAEMGAAFLCGHSAILNTTVDQSASYIQNWLEQLKNDRKLVIQAAAQAQKACDFILDVHPEDEMPESGNPKEYKVVALRECVTPAELRYADTPAQAVQYWRMHVTAHPYFNPECECFVVLLLNARLHIKGHQFVSIGLLDTILVHPREVFRIAIVSSAYKIVLMHNHPSGDASPSESDISCTQTLVRAGKVIKIEIVDHVIIGNPGYCSLKSMGFFYE